MNTYDVVTVLIILAVFLLVGVHVFYNPKRGRNDKNNDIAE